MKYAKAVWHEGLKAFEDDIVDLATATCRETKELPPTLPQFIDICRTIKKRNSCYQEEPCTKTKTKAVARANIIAIRRLLNMPTNPWRKIMLVLMRRVGENESLHIKQNELSQNKCCQQ